VALIRCEIMGEVRVVFLDEVRLVEGPAIDQCCREILDALNQSEERCVLLHFGRVAFMSSSALGMLIRIHKKCVEYKIALKLSNIAPDILKVFKITSLDKLFDIHADAAAALDAFQTPAKSFFRKPKPSSYKV